MITSVTVTLHPHAGDRRPSPLGEEEGDTAPNQGPRRGQAGRTGKGMGTGVCKGGNSYKKGQAGIEAGRGPAGHSKAGSIGNVLASREGPLDWHLPRAGICPSGRPPGSSPGPGPGPCHPMVSMAGRAFGGHLIILPLSGRCRPSADQGATRIQPGITCGLYEHRSCY